jgi:hypothetical protein
MEFDPSFTYRAKITQWLGYSWTAGKSGLIPAVGRHSCFRQSVDTRDLGSTQRPIQWVRGALVPGGKRRGYEDHSPLSTANTKNERSYTSTPLYVLMARCLINTVATLRLYVTYIGHI